MKDENPPRNPAFLENLVINSLRHFPKGDSDRYRWGPGKWLALNKAVVDIGLGTAIRYHGG